MPRKDPAAKREYQREWLQKSLDAGYGKRLYARRKLHREHKLLFQGALFEVMDAKNIGDAHRAASAAIEQARQEEEALSGWRGVADAPEG